MIIVFRNPEARNFSLYSSTRGSSHPVSDTHFVVMAGKVLCIHGL
jgi:hypothetical protein